eukprot:COSAG01_NODE_76237_length_188_cov_42.696629_1_plen_31_part_01
MTLSGSIQYDYQSAIPLSLYDMTRILLRHRG